MVTEHFKSSFSRFRAILLRRVFILLVACSGTVLNAQPLDSLRQQLALAEGANQSDILVRLAEGYLSANTDSARYFAQYAFNDDQLSADHELRASLVLVKVLFSQDSITRARYFLLRADNLMPNVTDKWYLMNYRMIRAYISELSKDFDDAINQNQMGLELALQEKDSVYLSRFYNNLGLAYKAIGQPRDAIRMLKQAARLFGRLTESINEASAWHNIGSIYIDLEQLDSALYYLELSGDYFIEQSAFYEIAGHYGSTARVAFLKGNFKEAIALLHQKMNCLDSASKKNMRPVILLALQGYTDLAECHFALGNTDSAMYFYKRVYHEGLKNLLFAELEAGSKGIYKIFEQQGNLDSTLFYFKAHVAWHDSLVGRENRQHALQIKADYELQKALAAEQANQQLVLADKERQNLVYAIIVPLLVVTLFAIYAGYQRSKKKQREMEVKALELEAEKRKLERDLAVKEKELTAKQVRLSENEMRIEQALKEIKQALLEPQNDKDELLNRLSKQIAGKSGQKSIASLDEYLKESDTRLYEALLKAYPDLTRSELRLCAFIRMNLSNKEIATITHQNANSLKMARYRLRKKMGLGKNQNLAVHINKIVSANT